MSNDRRSDIGEEEFDPSTISEFDRGAVVTIQGGGIYGFSLLGQLQAFDDKELAPLALA